MLGASSSSRDGSVQHFHLHRHRQRESPLSMNYLPTIIIVSILGFFICLTVGCIIWHWRKSRPRYVRPHSIGSHLRTPVRRMTIQGGRAVDVSSALEKASFDDDGYGDGAYPTLKAFVDPEDDLHEPPQAHTKRDSQDARSSWSTGGVHERFPIPGQTSEKAHRVSGVIRDAHSITIPAGLFSERSGSFALPRPSLINIEKKGSTTSTKAGKDGRETYPNERKSRTHSRSKSKKNRQTSEKKRNSGHTDKSVNSVASSTSKQKSKQRSSAPEPKTRKYPASSRGVSEAIPRPPPLPLDIIPTALLQQGPARTETDSKVQNHLARRSVPPEPAPRSSSLPGKRPPPLDLKVKPPKDTNPKTRSPSQPRYSLVPSTRTSTHSNKRPPPLDLKSKSSNSSLHGPSPLGTTSRPSPPPLPGPSPLSAEFKPIPSPVQPPPPLTVNPKPTSPLFNKPTTIATTSRASSRPPPLNLRPDTSSRVRFASTIEAHRRSFVSATDSSAALTPSTVDSPGGIVRAPPPSMIEEPLYRTPPPPTPGQLEAELAPQMVARLDRPPSLDVEIPNASTFSFFSSSNPSDPPHSNDLCRGPSVLSNRSGITIASSEISSNWTIGNAQLVNIYPSVGGDDGEGSAAVAAGGSLSISPSIPEEQRHTPPYAKTLRSKFGRYPRGRRDKALPTLPKSPLSMSFGVDEVEMKEEQSKLPKVPEQSAKGRGNGR